MNCPFCGARVSSGEGERACSTCGGVAYYTGGAPKYQRCFICAQYNNIGALSCVGCKKPLFLVCLVCGTRNPSGRSSCFMCGKDKCACPYCLTDVAFYQSACSKCGVGIYPLYADRYSSHPPFFVQVFGWPRVGKTVFLSALTLVLRKMGKVWPDYSLLPATDAAQTKIVEINRYLAKGVMPEATQRGKSDVYIMILQSTERWGDRMLVTRDCSGEIFDTFQVSTSEAPYLISVPTTLMLVSLLDLRNTDDGKSVDMLMTSYINTLRVNGLDFASSSYKERRLVVVLSKGDLIDDLPADLRSYLTSDPIWAALETPGKLFNMDADYMEKYVAAMKTTSDRLSKWLQLEDVGWINFVRLAQQHKMSLRFSLISSTGGPLGLNNELPTALAPRRVLDPYFWALESW